MVLNSTNMATTPKFMSTAQISSLNSRLINLTDDSTSPFSDKYLKHNMSKIKFLIFSMKAAYLTVFSTSVIGNFIFSVTRARHIKLILHSYLLTPYFQSLINPVDSTFRTHSALTISHTVYCCYPGLRHPHLSLEL